MPFVKLVKNKPYFKRFQTKFKRRREGRTDYKARVQLVKQSKNKYNSPKYRFVVRFSNKKVTCQVVFSEVTGDKVMCAAYSTELAKHGVKVGFKNYAAAYATGLLCARRLLTKVGLAAKYDGIGDEEANGELNDVEADEDKRPFRAMLDVGIRGVSTGNRLLGAVKGASDGGLDVPHNEKRFPGYDRDGKSYEAAEHAKRIYGEHIGEYIEELDEEEVTKLFADYVKHDIDADAVRDMWEGAHKSIRADPSGSKTTFKGWDKKFKRASKDSYDVKKERRTAKKQAIYDAAAAVDESDDDEDESDDDE